MDIRFVPQSGGPGPGHPERRGGDRLRTEDSAAGWLRWWRRGSRGARGAVAQTTRVSSPADWWRRPRHGHHGVPRRHTKIFITASPEVRAERRYKQLKEKGFDANLPRLLTRSVSATRAMWRVPRPRSSPQLTPVSSTLRRSASPTGRPHPCLARGTSGPLTGPDGGERAVLPVASCLCGCLSDPTKTAAARAARLKL